MGAPPGVVCTYIMIPRLLQFPARAATLLMALAGCATQPVHETQVVQMKPGALPGDPGLPPPGTTWRLEERELLALSPAPYVPPPPSPIPMPPRAAPAPLMVPYAAPYYGWGVPYYGPAFGFSFGYAYPRYTHRRGRR